MVFLSFQKAFGLQETQNIFNWILRKLFLMSGGISVNKIFSLLVLATLRVIIQALGASQALGNFVNQIYQQNYHLPSHGSNPDVFIFTL